MENMSLSDIAAVTMLNFKSANATSVRVNCRNSTIGNVPRP